MAQQLMTKPDGSFAYSTIEGIGSDNPDALFNAVGWDFKVQRSTVRYYDAPAARGGVLREHPTQQVFLNSNNGALIGTGTRSFEIVQPDAMRDLAKRLRAAVDGRIVSAMVTHGGAGLFTSIQVGDSVRIAGSDVILPYLLLATKNDGSMHTLIQPLDFRLWCQNQMPTVRRQAKHARTMRISHRSEFDAARLAAYWTGALTEHRARVEAYRHMAQTPVRPRTAEEAVFDLFNARRADGAKQVFGEPVPAGKRDITATTGYRTVLALFNGAGRGANEPGVKGTAWGLFNACTEYVDHHAQAATQANRFEAANFGTGVDMKDAAFERMMALVTA